MIVYVQVRRTTFEPPFGPTALPGPSDLETGFSDHPPAGSYGGRRKEVGVPILWILVILLVLLAIFGGVAINSLLWLVLIVALVVAVLALL